MTLPFGRVPPGIFDAAFPKSPTTGLPAMQQGVETQAKRMQAPAPMINTMASDKLAAQGMNGPAPMAAPLPPPASMMMSAAPSQAPVNPLGGMDSRPLSERGSEGPMSYAPKGVGTNNPNSYAVGRNNKNFAMRTGQAPVMMAPGPMMLGGPRPAPMMSPAPAAGAPAPMMPAPGAGRDDAFWNQMSSDTTAFLGEQQKLGMEMQMADQTAAAKIEERAQNTAAGIMEDMRKAAMARETYPILDPITGQPSPTHMMTGNSMMAPRMTAPPDGLVPTQAMIGGVQYEQPQPAAATKAPSFTYEKDPNGKITGAVYPVQDPKTGAWKLQRADLNGDGVVSPEEAAQIPAPTLAAAPVKTKGGNSYTLK